MTGFESDRSIQPQKNNRYYRLYRRKSNGYAWAVAIMFVVVLFLCGNHFLLLESYGEIKNDLTGAYGILETERQARKQLTSEDTALLDKFNRLEEERRQLEENYNKASRGSVDLSRQLEILKKQNSDLVKQNKDLANDNIALQNSLKIAASVGVKPQNYSLFDPLKPRDTLKRGKYLGKFLGTAYTPSKEECGNDKGITNSGKPIIPGVSIAIDNRYWPFGTVFYIKGLGYTVAMDTGSAIKGKYRFDFSVLDKQFAMQLGSRKWDVYLVKLGTGDVMNTEL